MVLTPTETSGTISIPANRFVKLGTLTSATFSLTAPERTDIENEYRFSFVSGSTEAVITWPSGISWNGGVAPTIVASKKYQVSIIDNLAVFGEF
jgi:hypothetical protein